ncbi:MAG: hypothetical protein ACYCU7_19020 [Acidimicrobiales bacterium]
MSEAPVIRIRVDLEGSDLDPIERLRAEVEMSAAVAQIMQAVCRAEGVETRVTGAEARVSTAAPEADSLRRALDLLEWVREWLLLSDTEDLFSGCTCHKCRRTREIDALLEEAGRRG